MKNDDTKKVVLNEQLQKVLDGLGNTPIDEVKIAEALGVAHAILAKRHLVHPFQFMADASIPKLIGHGVQNPPKYAFAESFGNHGIITGVDVAIIPVISSEKFVPAITTQYDLHFLARQFRNIVHANR